MFKPTYRYVPADGTTLWRSEFLKCLRPSFPTAKMRYFDAAIPNIFARQNSNDIGHFILVDKLTESLQHFSLTPFPIFRAPSSSPAHSRHQRPHGRCCRWLLANGIEEILNRQRRNPHTQSFSAACTSSKSVPDIDLLVDTEEQMETRKVVPVLHGRPAFCFCKKLSHDYLYAEQHANRNSVERVTYPGHSCLAHSAETFVFATSSPVRSILHGTPFSS